MSEVLGTDPGTGISGFGTRLSGASTGAIGMITKVNINGVEVDMLQVTTMNSPGRYRQFIAGLKDAKDMTLELVYQKDNMAVLLAAQGAPNELWTVTFPDGSTYVQLGFFKKLGTAIPFDDKITQSASLQFSGSPTFHAGSGG